MYGRIVEAFGDMPVEVFKPVIEAEESAARYAVPSEF
jgi:hypothetical protein